MVNWGAGAVIYHVVIHGLSRRIFIRLNVIFSEKNMKMSLIGRLNVIINREKHVNEFQNAPHVHFG